MKTIKNITALFEQTATETETKFKLLAQPITLPAGEGSIRIKWQYRFSWPAKNPLLGDVKELINTINNAKDGDAQQVLTAIKGSDKTHEVGIIRAEVSTQKNKIFGKDLGEFTGWIYLFYPDTINTQAIPANQKIASGIDNRMTYLMGADGSFQKYFKEPGTGKPADAKQTGSDVKPATVFTLASLTSPDGPAHDWFNAPTGLRKKYLNPVYTKIGKTKVPITTSGDIVPIFWGFVSNLPEDLATASPATVADLNEYSQNLKAAIQKLFTAVAKYDQSNFSAVNIDVLTQDLYSNMVYAVVILGLNSGKIDTNSLDFTTQRSSLPYYAPLNSAMTEAGAIIDATAAAAAGTAGTATAGFDGTAINNEMDLAKIISGGLIGYSVPAADVDTVDKVKAKWDASVKSGDYATTFDDIVKVLPFKKAESDKIKGTVPFQDIQYFVIQVTGQPKPYGPQTAAGFKAAFEKSSIK
jgi:hypothetical protein